jgi:hypothetical protein
MAITAARKSAPAGGGITAMITQGTNPATDPNVPGANRTFPTYPKVATNSARAGRFDMSVLAALCAHPGWDMAVGPD